MLQQSSEGSKEPSSKASDPLQTQLKDSFAAHSQHHKMEETQRVCMLLYRQRYATFRYSQ